MFCGVSSGWLCQFPATAFSRFDINYNFFELEASPHDDGILASGQ
jgi:hypothetical protein